MEIYSWGRYPRFEAHVSWPANATSVAREVKSSGAGHFIPRGLGRSYGDSSLAENVIELTGMDRFVAFDSTSGELTCEAGVSLDEILRTFVPRGWFLPVTPGTRYITIGGAIASDVHGKNHHVEGTFGDHVSAMNILLGSGDIITATPAENADLFRATCGGMGLTGVILTATFKLKPIMSSLIEETTFKCANLDEVLQRFEETKDATYSVAWIDCLATGPKLGRSLLMIGEHAAIGPLEAHKNNAITVPIDAPTIAMNKFTMSAFNSLYFHKAFRRVHSRLVSYAPFFYPLDAVSDWNRLYGKPGFTQYQFVLPFSAGRDGLKDVLSRIAKSGRGSMLAVLKVFGDANDNPLSFPFAGYTLALDFKVDPAVFKLLDELDEVVAGYGGRLYLTKDVRMTGATFKNSYPRWEEFESVRAKYSAVGKFSSLQSERLGLS